jgi:hypothetical protein
MKHTVLITILSLLNLVLIPGCASTSKKITSIEAANSTREYVFPRGKYQHRVELVIPANETGPLRSYRFNGVVDLQADAIQIVALSPFGTTVFKINENLITHEVKDEIYLAQMKPLEPKLLHYYSVMRELLLLRNDPKASATIVWKKTTSFSLPEVIEYTPTQSEVADQATFNFKKYDAHGIPENIEIVNPHFQVLVEITAYDI